MSAEEWDRIQDVLRQPIEQRVKPVIRKVDVSTLPSMGFKPVTRQTKRIESAE